VNSYLEWFILILGACPLEFKNNWNVIDFDFGTSITKTMKVYKKKLGLVQMNNQDTLKIYYVERLKTIINLHNV
jgi:hypothetical protein